MDIAKSITKIPPERQRVQDAVGGCIEHRHNAKNATTKRRYVPHGLQMHKKNGIVGEARIFARVVDLKNVRALDATNAELNEAELSSSAKLMAAKDELGRGIFATCICDDGMYTEILCTRVFLD